MKLKYEFLLITSFGFIYLKNNIKIYTKYFIKISKKINKQAFFRKNVTKKIKANLLITKPISFLLCYYIIMPLIKII